LIKRPWLIVSAACLVPAALDALQAYLSDLLGGGTPSWRGIVFQGSEWIFLGALTPITYVLARRYPLRAPHLWRNVMVHLAGALLLCVGWASLGVALRLVLGIEPRGMPLGAHVVWWLLTSLPWSVFMYFAVLGCVHAFSYYFEARDREAQAARLSAQLAESRLDALRMQLNPHFLFNSLNAITVLVRDQETRAATRMLELLSDVLRQVLRGDGAHEVTVDEELQFLARYLEIEQVRFSDRLEVRFVVDPEARGAAVPALVLQPLVENALRHGLAASSEPGVVEISATRDGDLLRLSVRDTGAGVRAKGDEAGTYPTPVTASPSSGVGLSNVRERLATMYGARASLVLEHPESGGTIATMTLPFRLLAR